MKAYGAEIVLTGAKGMNGRSPRPELAKEIPGLNPDSSSIGKPGGAQGQVGDLERYRGVDIVAGVGTAVPLRVSAVS